jgi:starch phosphorylase
MVTEYLTRFYQPAHDVFGGVQENNFQPARERVRWSHRVHQAWPQVRFTGTSMDSEKVFINSPISLRAELDLATLTPDDVRVEALVGRVGPNGELKDVEVLVLEPLGQNGSRCEFGRETMPYATGRLGFAVRVTPNHFTDPLYRPCNGLLKWAEDLPSL